MTDYTKSVDFAAKDSLPSGNANKVVSGTEINTEFANIEAAVNSKANTSSPTFTGTVTIPTIDANAGAIDGTTIGASSASTGAFTTLTASTGYTGAVDGIVGGNTPAAGTFTTITGTSLQSTSDAGAAFTAATLSNSYDTDSSGDSVELMFQHYRGYSPTLNDSAFIKAVKTQAWSSTGNRTSALTFGTRDGASEPAEVMRLDPNGNLIVGGTTAGAASAATLYSTGAGTFTSIGIGGDATPISGYGTLGITGSSGGVISFEDDGVEGVRVQSVGSDFYIQANDKTIFRNGGFTGSDEAARIDSSKNFIVGGTTAGTASAATLYANGNIVASDILPHTTEAQDLGSTSKEWDNLFVQNAVTVSDERVKNITGELEDEQIDAFLSALNTVWFTKKDTEIVVREAVEAHTIERQVTETITKEVERVEIEVVGDKAIRKVFNETVEEEVDVFVDKPVFDEEGKPVLDDAGEQLIHKEPVMETIKVPATDREVKSIPHSRPHSGFTAQQVKEAMTLAGIDDWAGYAYDAEVDKHFLRPNEFIGILVKGYQILKNK
jgi:hypothetical protein